MQSLHVGYKLKKVSVSFTRPADTTAYAVGDSVANSTSAPVPFTLDLSDMLAGNSYLELRKLVVVSSVKQATLPLFNVFLSAATFTTSNDNAALDIADAVQDAGGAWLACEVQNYTASNSRCAYVGIPIPMVMEGTDQKIYGAIQAANAYTPASEERFTVIAWVAIL